MLVLHAMFDALSAAAAMHAISGVLHSAGHIAAVCRLLNMCETERVYFKALAVVVCGGL